MPYNLLQKRTQFQSPDIFDRYFASLNITLYTLGVPSLSTSALIVSGSEVGQCAESLLSPESPSRCYGDASVVGVLSRRRECLSDLLALLGLCPTLPYIP